MILEIDDNDAFALLEVLRLTPIYVYLHMPDSEEREEWISQDFKPHKWEGYESDHCIITHNLYHVLLKAMQKATRPKVVIVNE